MKPRRLKPEQRNERKQGPLTPRRRHEAAVDLTPSPSSLDLQLLQPGARPPAGGARRASLGLS